MTYDKYFKVSALGGVALAVLMTASGAATAQDAPPIDQTVNEQEETEEIVITGTRITRSGITAPTPITILDSDSINLSGQTSLGELLNELPALGSTFTLANSTRFIGTAGANFLDLRRLGTVRTLVLVDGRRHVGSSAGTTRVDVNTIPVDLIERVEVVTGGASAIYGSDAVTGVVNFILKDDFEGANIRGQYGKNEEGGFESYFTSATLGGNFSNDRGNAVVSIEWSEQDRLLATRRPSVSRDYRQVNNVEGLRDRGNASNIDDFDEVIVPNAGLFFINKAGVTTLDFANWFTFNPDGSIRPVDLGPLGNLGGFECQDCEFLDLDETTDLQPGLQRLSINALVDYDLTDYLTIFLEGKYVNTETFNLGQPAFDFFTSDLQVFIDNPYLDQSVIDFMNDNGVTSLGINRFHVDAGRRGEDNERQTHRFVVGFEGRFNPGFTDNDWNYEISYTFGRTTQDLVAINNRINNRFFAATDAVVDEDGLVNGNPGEIVCRVQLQAAMGDTPTLPNGTTVGDDVVGPCVPTPFLGDGTFSAEAADYAFVDSVRKDSIEQQSLSGYVSGDIVDLPAGPLGFAIGGEWRVDKSESIPAAVDQLGITFGNQLFTERGRISAYEGFAEISVPVLAGLPGVDYLGVDAAVRIADYNTIGSVTAWKVGMDWTPVEDLRFRGTYSESVRAPNITELFGPLGQNFFDVDDPCSQSELDEDAAAGAFPNRPANCAALGRPAGFESAVDDATLPGRSGGNPDLIEESSRSYTVGAVLTPRWVPGFSLTVDYWNIRITDAISAVDAQDILDRCVDAASISNIFCPLVTRDPATFEIVDIIQTSLNIASLEASGVDFEARYTFNINDLGIGGNRDLGTMDFRMVGTRTLELKNFPFQDEPDTPDDELGELGDPKWAFNLNSTWRWDRLTFNHELRYLGNQITQELADFEANPLEVFPFQTGSVFYHDIQARYRVKDEVEVYFGIDNLADKAPPARLSGAGAGSGIYDNIGRFFYFGVNVKI